MNRITLATLILLVLAAAPLAAEDTPTTRSTAGGTLHLDTRLSHGFVPIGKPAMVYGTIRVAAGDLVGEDRAPLNVALVVDRSTSMSGGKLEQAKRASHQLVDMLGPKDRLAIVSYGSDVTTHSESLRVTPANKELLHNAVRAIRLGGSTNLSTGYERGRQLVMQHNSDETINRVLLLSDGHANVGITDIHQLGSLARRGLSSGVSVTTMGIGLDYNEELMTQMAREGAGNYYFVEDEKKIAEFFSKECHGLASTVARKAVLTIEFAPGVELLDLDGFAYEAKGNRVTIQLAEFFANQQKDILLEMSVSAQKPGRTPVLSTTLRFDDVTQSDKRVHSRAALAAVATNAKDKLADVDRDVMRRVKQVEVASTFDRAMKEFEAGNKDKAAKIVAEQRKKNDAFMQTYGLSDDAAFGRVQGELDDLEKNVRAAQPQSSEGKRLRKSTRARSYDIQKSAESF